MQFLDADSSVDLRNLRMYLTVEEAEESIEKLRALLVNTDGQEHSYLFFSDGDWKLWRTLITNRKLVSSIYPNREHKILKGYKLN